MQPKPIEINRKERGSHLMRRYSQHLPTESKQKEKKKKKTKAKKKKKKTTKKPNHTLLEHPILSYALVSCQRNTRPER